MYTWKKKLRTYFAYATHKILLGKAFYLWKFKNVIQNDIILPEEEKKF